MTSNEIENTEAKASNALPSDTQLRALARSSGDPWQVTNPYFDKAEVGFDDLWMRLIWPFIADANFSRCVDLAAGRGRNSAKLLEVAGELVILDINESLIEYCRKRFSGIDGVRCEVSNGYDLSAVKDDWATFVYCFDAMVHFDSDVVRSYLRDIKRALAPGGTAFLHHSNLTSAGAQWTKNPKARNFMSAELFDHYAVKEGLSVLKQQVIDWGDAKGIDCFSLVTRDERA